MFFVFMKESPECLAMFDESSAIDEEEKKEHEEISQQINDRLETNSEQVLQNSGFAGMYDMQEYSKTYHETRINPHDDAAVKVVENNSPNTSPGKGQANAFTSQINSFTIDSVEAKQEDKAQIDETIKSGLLEVVTNLAAFGTEMSHEDSMNDIYQ
jgi:hypothetical protein